MAKWIAGGKAKAGLWHVVVCPNVTGRTRKKIDQSKRARAGSLALVDYCRWHGVFLCCYICFVLLRFPYVFFVEAAALRSIALRHAGAPIATRVFFFFFLLFIWRCHFFRVFFVALPLSP